MSKYVITSQTEGASAELPFSLSPNTSDTGLTTAVTSIDLNNCFVKMDDFFNKESENQESYLTNIEEIKDGTITNDTGYHMFAYSEKLSSVSNVSFPNLTNGNGMFEYTQIQNIDFNLDKLETAKYMFENSQLKEFNTDLPELYLGTGMFEVCYELSSFTSSVPKLEDARDMFFSCEKLKYFSSYMPSITSSINTFIYDYELEEVHLIAPNLTYALKMFSNCTSLKTVDLGDISKVRNCISMFDGCENIENIDISVPNSVSSTTMFKGCVSLTSATVNIGRNNSYFNNMFSGCTALKNAELTLGSNTCSDVFSECPSLTSVTLNTTLDGYSKAYIRSVFGIPNTVSDDNLIVNIIS